MRKEERETERERTPIMNGDTYYVSVVPGAPNILNSRDKFAILLGYRTDFDFQFPN